MKAIRARGAVAIWDPSRPVAHEPRGHEPTILSAPPLRHALSPRPAHATPLSSPRARPPPDEILSLRLRPPPPPPPAVCARLQTVAAASARHLRPSPPPAPASARHLRPPSAPASEGDSQPSSTAVVCPAYIAGAAITSPPAGSLQSPAPPSPLPPAGSLQVLIKTLN